ncbi:MAG TPA: AAA family ATPase [Mucilaginibacter sp.]
MPNLYIISGCNGAGKTTASYTILPEMLNCNEFVNADNIAAGLSPFNPENVAIEAARIMLTRIEELLLKGVDFAIETTLASRSYMSLIKRARKLGYRIKMVYFWLSSPLEAKNRVAARVRSGGHDIPEEVIERRYYGGIYNLINLYISICDIWLIVNNMKTPSELVCQGEFDKVSIIYNHDIWYTINRQSDEVKR